MLRKTIQVVILVGGFVAGNSLCLAQGSAVSWYQSKDVLFDFDDEFTRVGSDFTTFSFATGFGSDVDFAAPGTPPFVVLSSNDSRNNDTFASTPSAAASSLARWELDKDVSDGSGRLTNQVSGTANADIALDPALVAVSWSMQSSTLDLGVPDGSGSIDWATEVEHDAGGGGLVNSSGAFDISDPVIVWVEDSSLGMVEPHRLFELTAQGDDKTAIRWRQLPDDMGTPFLDATDKGNGGGTGRFALDMLSDLIPPAQRGSLEFEFVDGIMTTANATGTFALLAPNPNRENTLPAIGEPALIDSLVIDNNDFDGRFQVDISLPANQAVSDVGACGEGVSHLVGGAVDSVQTFSVNPISRGDLEADTNVVPQQQRVPRPCLGSIAEDAPLLFGNEVQGGDEWSLVAADDMTPTIDRHMRLSLQAADESKSVVLSRGSNSQPAETRRWDAKVSVRDLDSSVEGIGVFAFSLVDVDEVGDDLSQFTLFSSSLDAVTFSVGKAADDVSVQLFVDGQRIEAADTDTELVDVSAWNELEASVIEEANATRFQLRVVGAEDTSTIFDTVVDGYEMPDAGYQLAVGTRAIGAAKAGHDFDNLILSHQQNGDLNWDTEINGEDVMLLLSQVDGGSSDPLNDVNLDGAINFADVEVLEDLVPNKLPGDANLDGTVDFVDFLALSASFGEDTGLWARGDFDEDGRVDFPDFLLLSANFGTTAAAMQVPEPSLPLFSLVVSLILLSRKRLRYG